MSGPVDTPVIIGFHGIGGSGEAPYIQEVLAQLSHDDRFRSIAVTLRGCGSLPLTSPQIHHAGHINDVGAVVAWAQKHFPSSPIVLLGGSLGAGMVHNFVGAMGGASPVSAVMLLSPVYNFLVSAQQLPPLLNKAIAPPFTGTVEKNATVFSEGYLQEMSSALSYSSYPPSLASPSSSSVGSDASSTSPPSSGSISSSIHRTVSYSDPAAIATLSKALDATKKGLSFTDFCGQFVAPVAGYANAEEFMEATSSVNAIPNVRIPVFALNANDDPLLGGNNLPRAEMSASAYSVMAVTRTGGHLGWFGKGRDGLKTESKRWSTRVAVEYFDGLRKVRLFAFDLIFGGDD